MIPINEIRDTLNHQGLFTSLSESEFNRVSELFIVKQVPRGEVLKKSGSIRDSIVFVLKGCLYREYVYENGKKLILEIIGEKDYILLDSTELRPNIKPNLLNTHSGNT